MRLVVITKSEGIKKLKEGMIRGGRFWTGRIKKEKGLLKIL